MWELKGGGESKEHFEQKLWGALKLRSRGYNIIVFECQPGCYDGIADVVGVDTRKKRVAVVEAKVSKADLRRDVRAKKKTQRARPSQKMRGMKWRSMLTEAYIAAPPSLFSTEDIPEGWGLLEERKIKKRTKIVKISERDYEMGARSALMKLGNHYVHKVLGMDWMYIDGKKVLVMEDFDV